MHVYRRPFHHAVGFRRLVKFVPVVSIASVTQEGFRFRNDDGSQTTATWRQSQDVNDTIAKETNFRLRFILDAATGDPAAQNFKLQYKKTTNPDSFWGDIPVA